MVGRVIHHYRVTSVIGEGGMGVVYKAEDTQLSRTVALKSLPAAAIADENRRARFMREARAASALNHPHIITIHDLIHDGADAFLVMEFIDGRTLEQLIHGRGLPLGEALRLAIPIASALAAAHQAGIVHRDLKPGNVMVTHSGVVKVLDFGLAKVPVSGSLTEQDATQTMTARTEEGAIVGTVSYMSPEQAQGKPVDARSDVFSFGSLFYEMLTGRKAFAGETRVSTLAAVLEREPVPIATLLPALPREVERFLLRCLRKDPAKRWQTMADVKVSLEELKEESDTGRLSGSLAGVAAAAPPTKGRWPLWTALGALLVAGVAGTAWYRSTTSAAGEPAMRKVTLTTYPGSEWGPSPSPDGRQIAFTWNGPKQDNEDIYVRMIEGGEPLRLTTDPAPDRNPRWSPDGRWIAFDRDKALYLVAPLGGSERRLTELEVSSYSWRPDSKAIALARSGQVVTYSLEDGRFTPIPVTGLPGVPGEIAYSNDGAWLAVSSSADNSGSGLRSFHVIPATGGRARKLDLPDVFSYSPTWAPGDKDLIFARDNAAGLVRVPVNGGPAVPIPMVAENVRSLALSLQPPRLFYSRLEQDTDLWSLEGARPSKLIASTRRDFAPRVSPDGARVAFTSDRTGSWEIYVSDIDGEHQTQLTELHGPVVEPCDWSPDGKELLVSSLPPRGNRDILILNAQGGAPRPVTKDPSEEGRARFSRDGRSIYFRSNRSQREEIWKMPREGGAAVQVTHDGGFDAEESLDGRTLYFTKGRSAPGLWAMPVQGGPAVLALKDVMAGCWTVTREGIIWLDAGNGRRGKHALRSWSPAGSRELAVIEAALWMQPPVLSTSLDGKRIVWHQYEPISADLVMIENFR